VQILSQRLQNLRVLKTFWRKGNVNGALGEGDTTPL
jgi:hypothetical protein